MLLFVDKPLSSNFQTLETADGSITLIHPIFHEAYSSQHGSWMQARELYLKQTQTHMHPQPKVLEIGFGLGVNFRTVLQRCLTRKVRLEYLSYELFPAPLEALESVKMPISEEADQVWQEVLSLWSPTSSIALEGQWGRLEIGLEDVTQNQFPTNWATAVFFDPFSPDVNPEPWQLEVLQKSFAACLRGAKLATYSVQGQFRRDLAKAGFAVRKILGIGKKQWTVGEKA